MQKEATSIKLDATRTFHWVMQGDKVPELYGWVENETGQIVKDQSGWYRTTDPQTAARVAASNLGIAF